MSVDLNQDRFAGPVATALADAQIAAVGLRETIIPAWPPAKRAFPAHLAQQLERASIFDDGFIEDLATFVGMLAAKIAADTHVEWEADENHVRGGYELIVVEEETAALARCADDLHAVRESVIDALCAARAIRLAGELLDA